MRVRGEGWVGRTSPSGTVLLGQAGPTPRRSDWQWAEVPLFKDASKQMDVRRWRAGIAEYCNGSGLASVYIVCMHTCRPLSRTSPLSPPHPPTHLELALLLACQNLDVARNLLPRALLARLVEYVHRDQLVPAVPARSRSRSTRDERAGSDGVNIMSKGAGACIGGYAATRCCAVRCGAVRCCAVLWPCGSTCSADHAAMWPCLSLQRRVADPREARGEEVNGGRVRRACPNGHHMYDSSREWPWTATASDWTTGHTDGTKAPFGRQLGPRISDMSNQQAPRKWREPGPPQLAHKATGCTTAHGFKVKTATSTCKVITMRASYPSASKRESARARVSQSERARHMGMSAVRVRDASSRIRTSCPLATV